MKKFVNVLLLLVALLFVLSDSNLWAQDFSYLKSTGIYHDYRFCTDRYEAQFGACFGEVIRLDVLFKLNVILGDPISVKFKNKTTGETYRTDDFWTQQIWSCDPDYDCAPRSEYLLPVDMGRVTGYWVVEVKYDKESSYNLYPKKQTFSFTSTPSDFDVIPQPPQGCQVIDDGVDLHVECDAVLGPPTHRDVTDCEEEETPPCVSYAVRIYDDTGTTIVPGEQPYEVFGVPWDPIGCVYIPPAVQGEVGKVRFTIDPVDVTQYGGNKFRFEQQYEGVGGVAVGDPAFLVSRAALYDLLTQSGVIEDCSQKASIDTDGSPTAYTVGGTVIDYTVWTGDDCASNTYDDYCSGNWVNEYGASGSGYVGPSAYNCESFESDYCSGQYVYRDEWSCIGSPGYCSGDATDSQQQDCGTDACVGICGSAVNGCLWHDKGCSGASCFDNAYDCDSNSTYCSGCGLHWNIGGEVSPTTCCGDDPGEYYVSVGVGGLGCCDGATDNCVDSGGICRGEYPNEQTCDDGIDNDCDGYVDDQDSDCLSG